MNLNKSQIGTDKLSELNMKDLKFPITELQNRVFQVKVDLTIYSQEALTATCYKYSGDYYVHQEKDSINSHIVIVTFEAKDDSGVSTNIPKQFCTDLVDQQLRVDINKQFGHIRDLIVEESFKPISK